MNGYRFSIKFIDIILKFMHLAKITRNSECTKNEKRDEKKTRNGRTKEKGNVLEYAQKITHVKDLGKYLCVCPDVWTEPAYVR